jgi:Protein of unknown function (DUF4038)
MTDLTVAPDGSHLLKRGQPYVLVADTAWSAFADATEAEWVHYLSRRRQQGFTCVAISVLPILHDRTLRPGALEPFAVVVDGEYDFAVPNEEYFARVGRFTELAFEHDLHPLLVLLWCNYVPGTWGAKLTPWAVMPAEGRRRYWEAVHQACDGRQPIFALSGDDRFDSLAANDAYREMMSWVSSDAPDCLITAHSAPTARLPDDIADSPDFDFFVYQSGHDIDAQDRCYQLAALYRKRAIAKPVINLEPAYERHGYGGGAGRYTAADVRKALWWSITGGASAGLGYGAHGIWQWHREGGQFTNPAFSMEPFPWQTALEFRGATDAGLAGHLISQHQLFWLNANQSLLRQESGGVRAASDATGSLLVVYLPFANEVRLATDLTGYTVVAWDLEVRAPIALNVDAGPSGSVVRQPDVLGDAVMIFQR